MSDFIFTWDEDKANLNNEKHKIKFTEAQTVFRDEHLLYGLDTEHSINEERFYAIGMSTHPHLLTVIHCVMVDGITVRIISARKANKAETLQYERRKI